MWHELRAHRLHGLHFRRQHQLGPYVVDFFCDPANLVVEVDGPIHNYRVERDATRDEWLDAQGYNVVRFDNVRVWCGLPQVLEEMSRAAEVRMEGVARRRENEGR